MFPTEIYNFGTLALSSRRLKVLFYREFYDFGTLSVSRPFLQKSQSATFPREISDV